MLIEAGIDSRKSSQPENGRARFRISSSIQGGDKRTLFSAWSDHVALKGFASRQDLEQIDPGQARSQIMTVEVVSGRPLHVLEFGDRLQQFFCSDLTGREFRFSSILDLRADQLFLGLDSSLHRHAPVYLEGIYDCAKAGQLRHQRLILPFLGCGRNTDLFLFHLSYCPVTSRDLEDFTILGARRFRETLRTSG